MAPLQTGRGRNAESSKSDLPYLFINPPLTDPTAPYHSLSYLAATARQAGFANLSVIDANVESLNFVFDPSSAEAILHRINTWWPREPHTNLNILRSKITNIARQYASLSPTAAIEALKSEASFYSIDEYNKAVSTILDWLDIITFDGLPFSYSGFFVEDAGYANFSSMADMSDEEYLELLNQPLQKYYETILLQRAQEADPALIGISVNYTRQLPFAAWICKLLKRRLPNALICCGGTEVTDLAKTLSSPSLLFKLIEVDLVVVGEGDLTLPNILEHIAQDQFDFSRIAGVITKGEQTDRRLLLGEPVDLRILPTPAYDIWDWKAYWSPEPLVLYSPTRGCYWNKCTFCDYGLNDALPTSPSRERPILSVEQDIRAILQYSDNIYLAVDAISPSFLRRFCAAIRKMEKRIFWAAECRMERAIKQRELARDLKMAGCVAISFGLESGNQRVLDLIDKGVKIEEVPGLLQALSEYDIGVELMTFYGFPTETHEEALDTLMFLELHSPEWQITGFGHFELTAGAIVARQPEKFGIEILPSSNEIRRKLRWQHLNWDNECNYSTCRNYNAFNWITSGGPWLRPFLGGIDTAHTLLYFKRYGTKMKDITSSSKTSRRHGPVAEQLFAMHEYQHSLLLEGSEGGRWTSAQDWLGSVGDALVDDLKLDPIPG